MAGLRFRFSDVIEELDTITKVAGKFLSPECLHVLPDLRSTLKGIRRCQQGKSRRWGIDSSRPLCTIESQGEYEGGNRRGRDCVFADITSIWEIEPLGPHGSKDQSHREFVLAGLASTRVRIYRSLEQQQRQQIGMWRMEIGSQDSPGCCFHVQVLGESDDPPFPRSLPIPRFPGLLTTPMSVVEFVLGELFQDRWRKHIAKETSDMKRWRAIQQKRLGKLLQWQCQKVTESPGSPWTELKWAIPPDDLFLETR